MNAPITMVDQVAAGSLKAFMKRLLQRIEHHVGAGGAGDSPANDPAGKGIDDEGDVHETLPSRDIGEIRHPQRIRLSWLKLPSHQVRRRGLVGGWHGRTDRLASHHASQPQPAHQALDGATSGGDRFSMQLAPDLADAVNAEVLVPNALDLGTQTAITLDAGWRAIRLGVTGLVLVVGRRGDRQHAADRLDPVRLSVIIN